MALLRYDSESASSIDDMNYPTDLMRQVAAKIVADVSMALYEHESRWKQAQDYVQTLPTVLQGTFSDLLKKHDQRLRDSYQWQLDYASALFQAIDDIEGTDTSIAKSFNGFGNRHHMEV